MCWYWAEWCGKSPGPGLWGFGARATEINYLARRHTELKTSGSPDLVGLKHRVAGNFEPTLQIQKHLEKLEKRHPGLPEILENVKIWKKNKISERVNIQNKTGHLKISATPPDNDNTCNNAYNYIKSYTDNNNHIKFI